MMVSYELYAQAALGKVRELRRDAEQQQRLRAARVEPADGIGPEDRRLLRRGLALLVELIVAGPPDAPVR
jgi:hypothetical protein